MKEQENTAVNLKTKDEFKEYMEMRRKEGWTWSNGDSPVSRYSLNGHIWDEYKKGTCVSLDEDLAYNDNTSFLKANYKIITLAQLKSGDDIGFFELFE